jgi:hypothetical protein
MIVLLVLDFVIAMACIDRLLTKDLSRDQQNRAVALGLVAMGCYLYVALQ